MNILKILNTGFKLLPRKRIVDFYVPLSISFVNDEYLYTPIYISFRGTGITEIRINQDSGELISIAVIDSDKIQFFNEDLDIKRYLSIQLPIFFHYLWQPEELDSNEPLVIPPYLKISFDPIIKIFKNAVVVYIAENIQAPQFLFFENELLGVLTDQELNVIGFITWNLSNEENRTLIEYAQYKKIDTTPTKISIDEGIYMMEHKELLLNKILELKNINYWELLYYGVQKKLIEASFCVDFSIKALEQNLLEDHNFTAKMAGLLKSEFNKIPELLEQHIQVHEKKDSKIQYYNTAWFYLTFAAKAQALEIID